MKLNGAEILIKSLEAEGVETVFGYPGGAVMEIFDALRESKIKYCLVRHEQGGGHAANGYARATGTVGVCIATSGPGATNLVTAIATAHMDSVPVVFITGQVPLSMVGTDAFQEIDITGITAPITKYNYMLKSADEITQVVAEAFYLAANGRPGPVLIDVPRDVANEICEYEPWPEVDIRSYKPNTHGHPGMIRKAAALLKEAENPTIICGGGLITSGAYAEAAELASRLQARVALTFMGLGSYPPDAPGYLGMLGTYGCPVANNAVQSTDCLLALGMRFDDRVISTPEKFAPQAKIIHIDIDPAEIGKNIAVDVPIVGDLKNVLRSLLDELGDISPRGVLTVNERSELQPTSEISPAWIIQKMQEAAPQGTKVTTDVGQHQLWTALNWRFDEPRSFISSGGLGTMGYGIPAALGVQTACPEDTVIAVSGDGSFQMGLPELGTLAENNLPVKILLFNNVGLGMVRQLQHHYFEGRQTAVDFTFSPDFSAIAKAYDAAYYLIEKPEDAEEVFKDAFQNGKLTLIECLLSPVAKVLPIVLGGCGIDDMHDE